MKIPWLLLIVLSAAFGQPKPLVLEGKVVDSVTGAPLRKVELTLTTSLMPEGMEEMAQRFGLDAGEPPDPAKPAAPKAPRKSYSATTDATGAFRFERVDSGDYYLTAKHAGYVDQQLKPPAKHASEGRLHLTAGDELADLAFRLVPHGALAGRIVDEDGDPVPDAMVSAMVVNYSSGHRRLVPSDMGTANERGEFRLSKLPPGRYFLVADAHVMNPLAQAPPPSRDGSPETDYVSTYFPKSADISQAESIDVKPASELSGFVIHLQKSKVVRVKGKLVAADGKPIQSAQVVLMSGGRPGSMRMSMVANPEGTFELAHVQPGAYMVMVMQMGGGGGSPSMTMQPLMVPSENVDNLKLGAAPDGKVQGTVIVNGDAKIPLKGLRLMLMGDESAPTMPVWGTAAESGEFTVDKVAPAPYMLSVPGVPAGAYLKSILWNGRDMLGHALDFTPGTAGDLQVVIGTDGGHADVAVSSDDKPVAEATVVLLPADPARRFAETTRSQSSDASGHAVFKDVPPGSYLVYAWEKVEEGQWFNPDFLKPVAARGTSLTIAPKANEKLQVQAVPK